MRDVFKIIKFVAVIILLHFFTSCNIDTIVGKGNVLKKTRTVSNFNKVEVSGAFEIILKSDSIYKVEIEADSNLFSIITTNVKDSVLQIKTQSTVIKSEKMKIYIFSPQINQIDVSGAIEMLSDSILTYNNLTISVSGAARLDLKINAKNFVTNVSGGSEMFISGKTEKYSASITGAGRVNAADFVSDTCKIDLSGFGKVEVFVNKLLEVNISGAGKVKFNGNARVVENITGAGKVEKTY